MSKTSEIARCAGLLLATFAAAGELPQASTERHEGVATCAASQCHGSAVPREGSNVLQTEYVTWTQDDPHSQAYATLSSELSRAIAARLGLASAREAGICLDCHADNVPAGRRGERFQLSDGVGCEACHGGAEHWLATHYDVAAVTREDSVAAGLYPTDRAADRAELCLSCHLGTRAKFATHRLMAAGHPRLSFELDTFTELWRTAGRQPHYRVDDDYRERKAAESHSYTWAVGVLAEARRRLALAGDPAVAGGGLFPELGLYDCHACHRTMQSVAWRRLPRHGSAAPGAPFLNDGALVMSLALARAVAADDAAALEAGLADLHAAGSTSRDALRAAIRALDADLERLQGRVSERVVRERSRAILREILAAGADGEFLDYISAEQAFMAVQLLAIELGDAELEAALEELAATLEDEDRYRPARFAALLAGRQAAQ